ncbi:MAG: HSP20 family protein [Oleispira sp.]|jgi:HSP20 family protein
MNLTPRHSLFNFDHFFDHFFSSTKKVNGENGEDGAGMFFTPRVDVAEKEGQYLISTELPGVNKDDISISLENGVLSIEAENSEEKTEEKDGKVIRQERRYGKFVRSFNLGQHVQESDIHANFDNGILKLSAPIPEEEKNSSKRIQIN